jgi:hypothetical protein
MIYGDLVYYTGDNSEILDLQKSGIRFKYSSKFMDYITISEPIVNLGNNYGTMKIFTCNTNEVMLLSEYRKRLISELLK